MLPAKLLEHFFNGFLCLGNLALEDPVEAREVTFGWTKRSLTLTNVFLISMMINRKTNRCRIEWIIL